MPYSIVVNDWAIRTEVTAIKSEARCCRPPCNVKVSGNVNIEAIALDDADAVHPNQYTPNLSLLAATLSPYVESEVYP